MNNLQEVNEKVNEYLELKAEAKEIDARMKVLKSEHIDVFADSVSDEFVDGEYRLNEASLKLRNNPPKLVHANGKPLGKEAKGEFCKKLPTEYVTLSPTVPLIITKLSGDKQLKNVLKSNGIEVSQDSRYDVVKN